MRQSQIYKWPPKLKLLATPRCVRCMEHTQPPRGYIGFKPGGWKGIDFLIGEDGVSRAAFLCLGCFDFALGLQAGALP